MHYAQSLDGRIATRTGDARWISGEASTRYAHELRAENQAVIIGSGTAITDDPQLTVRHVAGSNPLRLVLDGRGRLPKEAKLATCKKAPTIHVTTSQRAIAPHVECWVVPPNRDGEGVDLEAVLARLVERGVERVLVEGGRRVITAFLKADLVDRLIVSIAPMILGEGIDAVADLGITRIAEARRLAVRRVQRLGDDTLVDLERA